MFAEEVAGADEQRDPRERRPPTLKMREPPHFMRPMPAMNGANVRMNGKNRASEIVLPPCLRKNALRLARCTWA